MLKTKYYIEIVDTELDMDPPYIIQSSWFNTIKKAKKFANNLDYVAESYEVRLMKAEGEENEEGYWEYEDIDCVEVLRK